MSVERLKMSIELHIVGVDRVPARCEKLVDDPPIGLITTRSGKKLRLVVLASHEDVATMRAYRE